MTGRDERVPRETAGTVALARVRGPGRGTAAAVLSMVLLVGVLVAKPWSSAAPTQTHAGISLPPRASPMVTASLSTSSGRNAVACLDQSLWRVVTVERSAGTEEHGWYRVNPVRRTGSDSGPRIAFRRIVTGSVHALGFCTPAGVPAGAVRIWHLHADGRGQRLDGVEALDDSGGPSSARLFRPPSLVGPYGFASWPIGTYAVAVRDTDGERTWWFGLHLVRSSAGTDGAQVAPRNSRTSDWKWYTPFSRFGLKRPVS
jgi:hypothetical protein